MNRILDLAHVICIMITVHNYLINNFGNNDALQYLYPYVLLFAAYYVCLRTDINGYLRSLAVSAITFHNFYFNL